MPRKSGSTLSTTIGSIAGTSSSSASRRDRSTPALLRLGPPPIQARRRLGSGTVVTPRPPRSASMPTAPSRRGNHASPTSRLLPPSTPRNLRGAGTEEPPGSPRAPSTATRNRPRSARGARRRVSRRRSAGLAHDEARLDADARGAAAGTVDPLQQELGGDPRALGRADVDRRQGRPRDGGERGVVHPDDRDVVGDPEPGVAEGGQG